MLFTINKRSVLALLAKKPKPSQYNNLSVILHSMYVTQHTLKVTHLTRTLDLKMKKESALQHRNNSKTCTLGKKKK